MPKRPSVRFGFPLFALVAVGIAAIGGSSRSEREHTPSLKPVVAGSVECASTGGVIVENAFRPSSADDGPTPILAAQAYAQLPTSSLVGVVADAAVVRSAGSYAVSAGRRSDGSVAYVAWVGKTRAGWAVSTAQFCGRR